jgi:CSLREA domain-containing protein
LEDGLANKKLHYSLVLYGMFPCFFQRKYSDKVLIPLKGVLKRVPAYRSSPVILLFFALCLLVPGSGTAKQFTVNSREDLPDLTPGDDKCVSYLITLPPYVFIFCTLRAAIEEANSLPGDDEILVGSGTYTLEIEGTGENVAATGDLDITDTVTLSGKGREATHIDGGGLDRIFDIHGVDTRVAIHDLSLQNGKIVPDIEGVDQGGGAIRNYGMLTLSGVALSENSVQDGDPDNSGGGALYNLGYCRLTGSSVFFNEARSGGALWNGPDAAMFVDSTTLRHNFSRLGGGVFNLGALSLVNSTVSNNGISDEASKALGIYNSGKMEIVQSTIAGNNDGEEGAGLLNEGDITIVNSVIASHGCWDCVLRSPLTSSGGNLDSDGSCNMDHETDLSEVDPLLSSLGSNGGPTWSHVFLLGSLLKDNGLDLSGREIGVDQRGKERPRGKGYDIGAVEQQFSAIIPVLVPLLL